MPVLQDGLSGFTGTIGNLTFYRENSTGRILVRAKGGISKKRIKYAPEFERTRENNMEFGGCARAVATIRDALYLVRLLADYNFTPRLQSIARSMQLQDPVNIRGRRTVCISEHAYLLDGFQLNKKHTLDNVVRQSLRCTIEKEQKKARIEVPGLLPMVNLFIPWKSPYYRLIFNLGVIRNMVFKGDEYDWKFSTAPPVTVYSDWIQIEERLPAQSFELVVTGKMEEGDVLMLSGGIETGTPNRDGTIWQVERQGAGKILMTG